MNRYGRGPTIGGPSKATATTQCQKCLKRGHYSYECKAVVQERPYVSRPSRTQQLLNPKLVPKLTSDVPQDLLRKKGVADEQLAKAELERGRKRERQDDEGTEVRDGTKRMRSASSDSVSTISTNMSQSPPRPARDSVRRRTRSRSLSQLRSKSRSASPRRDSGTEKRKRRRDSSASSDSYISRDQLDSPGAAKERGKDRSTRRRYSQQSPPARGRNERYTSPSPDRGRRRHSNDRRLSRDLPRDVRPAAGHNYKGSDTFGYNQRKSEAPRERSLSPFSKRLALTQAMNRQ